MNLNDFLINRARGRSKKFIRNKNYTEMGPPRTPAMKKDSTPSSDLIWGKSHISVANTSTTPKSAGSKISSDDDSRVVVALTEGRGEARCEVGIAAIDISKPQLILCQISDTQSYINTLTKINIFNPHEILVPLTFVEKFSGNRLIDKVKEHFPRIKYTGCARSTFNKTNGMDILADLCIPSLNAILLVLEHRYYALAAVSALITYVQDNLFIYYATGSIKIDYQESEGYSIIDVSTADRLELVCSAKPAEGNKYSSLFGVLNHCLTKIGARTLRSSILQPPCKIQYIEERLDVVADLIRHPEMLLSIQALLQKVTNIDLLLGIATLVPDDPQKCSSRQLNYILLLNTLVDLVTPLKEVLAKSDRPFFVRLRETLGSEEFVTIRELVRETIQDNAHPAKGQAAVMQRCFAIKAGINGLLDLVRKTYSERLDDMREYVKRLAEKYDLALTLGNNQTKGYHIVLSLNQNQKRYMKKPDLPEEFIEVYRLAGSFTMKTPELVNLSTRLDDIMADILRISNVMVHSIIIEIKKYVSLFYKLCEEIAQLDMLQSLAECSVRNGYVRPKFGDYFTEVTFAHHPLLDFLLPTKPVSNPISCSNDYNLHIITGPNGSGKSIYIRQVMLLQIMAQVGCYVPAQTAIFRPADRMFARIYLEDNMEHGASSFVLEMKEVKYIMTTMTKNSLIIIDELCRSTSLEEGTALAIALVEKLAQSSGFIYITTHFTLLTKLYEMYLNVKVWQMETIPSGADPKTFKLDYKYNLIPGITSVKRYGTYIVRNIWHDDILKNVDAMLDSIANTPKNPNILSLDAKVRLKYDIESQFRKLKSQGKLTRAEINKLLNQYQNELEKLDFPINVKPLPSVLVENTEQQLPRIEHSIFYDIANENYSEESRAHQERLNQNFAPNQSLSSQLSANLEQSYSLQRIKDIFTPEPSQENNHTNAWNKNSTNLNFYQENAYNYDSSDNYENISRFIAENSENVHKLIPEINLSYEDVSSINGNNLIVQQSPIKSKSLRSTQGSDGSRQASSFEISKDLDNFRFALPLQNNIGKTSTPVHKQSLSLKSASPVVRICGDNRNFSSFSNTNEQSFYKVEQKDVEDLDIESIQEELEVCSRIFGDEDDHFQEESLSTIYRSLQESRDEFEEKPREKNSNEKIQHIIPVVTVVEGPNNTTVSFDEDDFRDIVEDVKDNDVEEHSVAANVKKINIISNIVVAAGEGVSKMQQVETRKENTFIQEEKVIVTNENNVEDKTYKFEEIKVKKKYKNFDSTFEAARSNTESFKSKDSDDAFMSLEEDTANLYFREGESQINHGDTSQPKNMKNDKTPISDDQKEVIEECVENIPNAEDSVWKKVEKETVNQQEKSSSPTVVDKTETSISYASKLRKLEQISSDSTQEESTAKKPDDKTITSISAASKMRNLDQATTDSTSPNEKSDNITSEGGKLESSSSLKESDESKTKTKASKRKISIPKCKDESSESTDPEKKNKKRKKLAPNKKKFIPPRKLSSKEIMEEFREQDRKILESSPNSSNFSKYLELRMNRPTVKQVQNTTHLAMVRKTNEGVEVIPAVPRRKKTKVTPLKRHHSNENFSMSIFSDKNALPFESYLNSNEKDYKTFSFNFNKNQEEQQKFEFQPTTLTFGDYTSNSVTKKFVRNPSETISSQQQLDRKIGENMPNLSFCISQSIKASQSLTPDGFYKQNKEDITRIMRTYLRNNTEENRMARNVNISRNVFETNDIESIDLNI